MNVGEEMALLAEAKDIRNELHIISTLLKHQTTLLPQLRDAIAQEFESLKAMDKKIELKTTFDDQVKTIESHLQNIDRMDSEADDLYNSVIPATSNLSCCKLIWTVDQPPPRAQAEICYCLRGSIC